MLLICPPENCTICEVSIHLTGQVLAATDNLGKASHMQYDVRGNQTAAIDALGNETDMSFNLANQPVQTTFPATGQQGPSHAFALNAYLYPDGPLLSTSSYDESGAAIRQMNYAYGQEGEMRGVSGSTEPVTYTYDALYRLSGLADGGGSTTHYFYNTAGHLYQVAYPGAAAFTTPLAAGTRDTVTFPAYDTTDNILRRIKRILIYHISSNDILALREVFDHCPA